MTSVPACLVVSYCQRPRALPAGHQRRGVRPRAEEDVEVRAARVEHQQVEEQVPAIALTTVV